MMAFIVMEDINRIVHVPQIRLYKEKELFWWQKWIDLEELNFNVPTPLVHNSKTGFNCSIIFNDKELVHTYSLRYCWQREVNNGWYYHIGQIKKLETKLAGNRYYYG